MFSGALKDAWKFDTIGTVHDIERAAGAVTLVEVVLSPGHTSALKFVSIARHFIHGPQRQICFKNNSRHLAI